MWTFFLFKKLGSCSLFLVLAIIFRSALWAMGQCSPDRLILYQVSMKTHWAQEDFPKDYPKFRPPAQWSKLVGRSHGGNFSIFRLGGFASAGLKKFAESGSSDLLDDIAQGNTGILDAFTAPNILNGVGEVTTNFFADATHSKVSIVCRLVPSPDWFVGVESLDLCLKGQDEWVKSISLQVDGIDAGTDRGYTFTAPRWPSVPQEAIYQITPQNPSHPASSFYYPDRTRHLPLATFTFVKLKEYNSVDESTGEAPGPLFDDIDNNDFNNELSSPTEPRGGEYAPSKQHKKRRFRKSKGRECILSKWTEWSDCSSKTCDITNGGEQYRTRSILRNGGCDYGSLYEKRPCTGRDCRQNIFDWRSQQK